MQDDQGLFGFLNRATMNPLFMGGMQGLFGGNPVQGMQTGLMAQKSMREDEIKRKREAAFAALTANPEWAAGLPKGALPLAQAAGSEAGLGLLSSMLTKRGDNDHSMNLFERQKAMQFGLERQKMEYQRALAQQDRQANMQVISGLFGGQTPGAQPMPGAPPQPASAPQQPFASPQPGVGGPPPQPGLGAGGPGMAPPAMPELQPVNPQRAALAGMLTNQKPEFMKMLTQQGAGEEAIDKGRGEGLAKRFNSIAEDGMTAGADLQILERLNQLSNNVDPGARTALLEQVRKTTGVALDPNASNVQAFQAAVNYMMPRMRVPNAGASSDRDMESFKQSLPSILGTPGGNELVLQTLGGMARRKAMQGEIASAWQRREITAQDADKQFKALPDGFEQYRAWQGGQKSGAPQPGVTKRSVVNGKTYVERNGKWFAE